MFKGIWGAWWRIGGVFRRFVFCFLFFFGGGEVFWRFGVWAFGVLV